MRRTISRKENFPSRHDSSPNSTIPSTCHPLGDRSKTRRTCSAAISQTRGRKYRGGVVGSEMGIWKFLDDDEMS